MKMPNGKHKGKEIYDLPSGYLKWLSENYDDDEIAAEADQEYKFREQFNTHIWED